MQRTLTMMAGLAIAVFTLGLLPLVATQDASAEDAWTGTVILSTSRSQVDANDSTLVLTATPSKAVAGSYFLSIYDDLGTKIAACGPGSGAPSCPSNNTLTAPMDMENNTSRTYTAYVALDMPNPGPPISDVRATSSTQVKHLGWTGSLKLNASRSQVDANDPNTVLTATPSKAVAGKYFLSIYDDLGTKIAACGPGPGAPSCPSDNTLTVPITAENNSTRTYTAYVALDMPNPGPPTNDVRAAVSVKVRHLGWNGSVALVRKTDGSTVELTATPSSAVAGKYFLSIYDDLGTKIAACGPGPGAPSCPISNKLTTAVEQNSSRTYAAYVALDFPNPGPPTKDVRAISGRYSTAGLGPVAAGETAGGSNPSEACSQRCHGDPVNSVTGEFWESTPDLSVAGRGPMLALTRSYATSQRTVDGSFGYGWRSSLDMSLSIDIGAAGKTLATSDQVRLVQENGSAIVFSRAADGSYVAPDRVLASLESSIDGNFVFTREQRQKFIFDASGQLVSIKDLNGNSLTLTYTGTRVTGVSDGRGQNLSLTWSAGHLIGARDHAGRTVSYDYSAVGDLVSVTAVDGAIKSYAYDSAHRVSVMTFPGGGVVTNTYDAADRVLSQTDAMDGRTTFTYDTGLTRITDPDGGVTIERHMDGQVFAETKAAGTDLERTTTYTYNSFNKVTSSTDPLGGVTLYAYDGRGNVTSTTDPLGRTSTVVHDKTGNLTSRTDPLGRTLTYTYDSNGNLIEEVSASGRRQTWTINEDGSVATWTNAVGGTSTYEYDAAGRQTEVTDPDGRAMKTRYNTVGQVNGITAPGVPETTRKIDPEGRVLAETDPRGNGRTTTYDADGNVTKVTDSNGHSMSSTFDAAGRQLTATDAAGKTTAFSYDATGRMLTSTGPSGAVAKATWTAFGQKATATDATGNTTTYTYDDLGNLVSSASADGTTVTNTYDSAGQLTSTTDALGKTTTYGYDDAGQQVSVTDPAGRVTTTSYTDDGEPKLVTSPDHSARKYEYDRLGNVTAFTNQDGKRATYAFNDAGLRTKKTDAGGISTTYTYDGTGKVVTSTDGNGITTTYTYDDNGQLTKAAAGTDTPTKYSYDPAGNRTGKTDNTGTSTYEYDATNHLTAETNGVGARVAYGYDDAGLMTSITYPGSEKTVAYTRNESGQVTKVTDWTGHTVSFSYDTQGNLVTQTAGNGVATTIDYDDAHQATSMTSTHGSDTLAKFDYTYTAAGEVASASTSGASITAPAQQYSYDQLGQLASSNDATYTASSAGSLTAAAGSTLTYNAAQQVITLSPPTPGTAPAASTEYTYDDAGNRVTASNGTAQSTYEYDASGNLRKVTGSTGGTVSYTTDGTGLRTSRTSSGDTDQLTWSTAGSLPLLLDDGTTTYIYGISSTPVVAIDDSTGTSSYLSSDLIGTPRVATNDAGAVTGTASYDAYGNQLEHTGTMPALGYTGGLTDPDTGLVYLRARSYDPASGQFTTLDPAIDATSQPYAYAGNNPILNTDPTGLWWGSDAWQWYATNWESGAESITMTKGGTAVGNFLNSDGGSFLAGFANGISFGLGGAAARLIAPEQQCVIESRTLAYGSGTTVGAIATAPLTGAAGGAARGLEVGLASTGRTTAANLTEQLAMKQAMSNPSAGRVIINSITDPKWPGALGWQKVAQNVNGVEIHFVRNKYTGAVNDFKFKN